MRNSLPKTEKNKTPQEALEEMQAAGISIRAWAEAHQFNYEIAKAVLQGRLKGVRGESFRIAVALGIKKGRPIPPSMFCPPVKATPRMMRVVA